MKASSKLLLTTFGGMFFTLLVLVFALRYIFLDNTCYASASDFELSNQSLIQGQVMTKTALLPPINSVKLEGNFAANLTNGPANILTISGPVDNFPPLKLSVRSEQLNIIEKNTDNALPVNLALTLPSVNSISVAGQTTLQAKQLIGDKLELNMQGNSVANVQGDIKNIIIHLNGNAKLYLNAANEDTVNIQIAGSGSVVISGAAKKLIIKSAGNTIVDAKQLTAEVVAIKAAGNSVISIRAVQALTVSAAGSCSIRYYGTPTITKMLAGESSIEQIND